MYRISTVENAQEKSDITDRVLHRLPKWFGVEKSIIDYVQSVRKKSSMQHMMEMRLLDFCA